MTGRGLPLSPTRSAVILAAGTCPGGSGRWGCLHLVSASAAESRLILRQEAVAEKSNEIAAIPRLLAVLELKGR